MPYNLYISKVLEDVELLMTQTNFKNKNIKKINPNVEIINKILFKGHKDVDYVAKLLWNPSNILLYQWENTKNE